MVLETLVVCFVVCFGIGDRFSLIRLVTDGAQIGLIADEWCLRLGEIFTDMVSHGWDTDRIDWKFSTGHFLS